MTTCTISAHAANASLAALAVRIAGETVACERDWAAGGDEATREAAWSAVWALRAEVAATPARTFSELRAKASILAAEAKRDAMFECDAPGSARDLALALARDVMALTGN